MGFQTLRMQNISQVEHTLLNQTFWNCHQELMVWHWSEHRDIWQFPARSLFWWPLLSGWLHGSKLAAFIGCCNQNSSCCADIDLLAILHYFYLTSCHRHFYEFASSETLQLPWILKPLHQLLAFITNLPYEFPVYEWRLSRCMVSQTKINKMV